MVFCVFWNLCFIGLVVIMFGSSVYMWFIMLLVVGVRYVYWVRWLCVLFGVVMSVVMW